MRKIQHNTEAIYITSRGFNIGANNAEYSIFTELNSLPKAIELFGNVFAMIDEDTFVSGGTTAVNDLPDILATYQLEQSDVGKKVDEAMNIFGTNIIWMKNSLNLKQEDWTIVSE